MYTITHSRPHAFYDVFERKAPDPETTHYCPGCGHGVLHKLIAEAIDDLGIADRTILVSPVGCSVFAYYYLDVGNVQAAHGRASAVATGIKRVRPDAIVLCYQGDGDLAAIGGNEILHAANRGENVTVFFVNNGIYGMTGGQMAPTTPLGARTITSPAGRTAHGDGYPLRVCELLATLDGPAYIERVALTDGKQHMRARRAVRRAIENQVRGVGFSLVEVLSACPTGWKMTPEEAVHWVEGTMLPTFPLGVFRDRRNASGISQPIAAQAIADLPTAPSEPESAPLPADARAPASERPLGALARGKTAEAALKIAGAGGQGVLFIGLALAEAAIREGLEVSWLPSYGPEMRGGTAHCHLRLSRGPIASPLVSSPSAVLAFNQPSVDRFLQELEPGRLLVVNTSMAEVPVSRDVRVLAVPATEIARDLGNPRVANLVLLGAYLEETHALEPASVLAVLRDRGMPSDLLRLNALALDAGRNSARRA